MLLGVGLTTLQRCWRQFAGDGDGLDRRKGYPRLMSHLLTEEERQRILLTCNQPEFASLPPGQIVPSWRTGASTSALSAASIESSMPMVRPTAAGGPAFSRSRVPFRA